MQPKAPSPRVRNALFAVFLAAIAVLSGTYALLDHATTSAATCVALMRTAGDLDACSEVDPWLNAATIAPWTAPRARVVGEELHARVAVECYLDACVGHPDAAQRAAAAEGLLREAKAIGEGSKRVTLGDLGPQMGTPNLGLLADLYGDRPALLAGYDGLATWQARVAAIRAAFLEGDPALAQVIAARYAEFDPWDPDLRSTVGAALCLGKDTSRGLVMLQFLQERRAHDRNTGSARDFGDERTATIACAALGGVAPPKEPEAIAGNNDAIDAQAALRLRVAKTPDEIADAMRAADDVLAQPLPYPGARLAVLAELLVRSEAPDAHRLATLARFSKPFENKGESPLAPAAAWSLAAFLSEPTAPHARAPASTYDAASLRAEALAQDSSLAPAEAASLKHAAFALALGAARAHALVPTQDERALAEQALTRAALGLGLESPSVALTRSTIVALTGDLDGALNALDPSLFVDASISLDTRIGGLAQRALLLHVLGRLPEAAALGDEVFALADSGAGDLPRTLATWTRTAVAPKPTASAPAAWVWAGYASPTWNLDEPWKVRLVQQTAEAFEGAATLPAEERRRARYDALTVRGDMPPAVLPYFLVAARLAPDAASTEVWLDALTTIDGRRISMRALTWSRFAAARARGDGAAAALWSRRFDTLARLASDPLRMDAAALLGL